MKINPVCWVIFYCTPLLNILCYNTNYTESDYIIGTNISTSYNSTIAFEYRNYDYSNNTFILEKWFGRENIENVYLLSSTKTQKYVSDFSSTKMFQNYVS